MKNKRIIAYVVIASLIIVGFQVVRSQNLHLLQSLGATFENYIEPDYDLGSGHLDSLLPYPEVKKGERTPLDLWKYAGAQGSSFVDPNLPMSWEKWVMFHEKQKPILMLDIKRYMDSRYDFNGAKREGEYMSGGRKPIMKGPISRLPKGISSFEELAELLVIEIKEKDLFQFKPLAHPLASTANIVFPDNWNTSHPEHLRIDVDHDYPDEYLPVFPPPIFLTTHKARIGW